MTALQGDIAPFIPLVQAAEASFSKSGVGKAVKEGVNHFFEGMPVFMNALDAVADLHPFIGVVVLAFKTVYTLELKRRDNEAKTIALYVEMKDMMSVLLQLRDMHDEQIVSPDQTTLEDRLKTLVETTAKDIKECSNTCDAYAKKTLLAKVVQGPMWDSRLLTFVSMFNKRRTEFEFALSIHTSLGVDSANTKLDGLGEAAEQLNAKMNTMLALFQEMVNPEQKGLASALRAKGGVKAVRENDKAIRELQNIANKSVGGEEDSSDASATTFNRFKSEVFEDPGTAIDRNLTIFSRKYEVQKRQIIDELTLVVKRESDRVIQEVTNGPHDRILDRDIYDIWKEMRWRDNVKARHFVMAFRDYYVEKISSEAQAVRGVSSVSNSRDPDAWAIQFIDILHLQPILEFFDDDTSGFITIKEMNRFTSSRPIDWSLPLWVAYWGVGWKSSMINYAKSIEHLWSKMDGMHTAVLAPNRDSVARYQIYVWRLVHKLTATLTDSDPDTTYLDRFQSPITAEEERLKKNLEAVDYVIDGLDTLKLIIGEGRLEKTLFPLIYLFMKHHYDIMRVARRTIISKREIWDAIEGMQLIEGAINDRHAEIDVFRQQKMDVTEQFQSFACGIFKYYYQQQDLMTIEYIQNLDVPIVGYGDTSDSESDLDPADVLKQEYKDNVPLDDWVYDGETIHKGVDASHQRLGHWHGYWYTGIGEDYPWGCDTMLTMVLMPAEGEQTVRADAWCNLGRFKMDGTWTEGENREIKLTLRVTYISVMDREVVEYIMVDFHPDSPSTLAGVWGMTADPAWSYGAMGFRRTPSHYLIHYPTPFQMGEEKARSLWKFAINCMLDDVRRERWSWSYLAERRDKREAYMALAARVLYNEYTYHTEEEDDLVAIVKGLTPADACFYASRVRLRRATTWIHGGIHCDNCSAFIGPIRLVCMDCKSDSYAGNTLDICDAPACVSSHIFRSDLASPHAPTHRLLKARTALTSRQFGRVYAAAHRALEKTEPIRRTIASRKAKPGSVHEDVSGERVSVEEAYFEEDDIVQEDADVEEDLHAADRDDVPRCGSCHEAVDLPCWFCIICEADLYICDACDAQDITSFSGPWDSHDTSHHLIRCQEPEPEYHTITVDQRVAKVEERIDEMRSQFSTYFDALTTRVDGVTSEVSGFSKTVEERLHGLSSRVDGLNGRFDELSGRFDELNGQLGSIEQLLQLLARAHLSSGTN
ncbi:hypothetical protein BC834DRAFT_825189 [Gloeopeniophorella convolvens]|nr:hypothetical protein BC834DRAFT_825189 [Gloeopeniophorella convolvens]